MSLGVTPNETPRNSQHGHLQRCRRAARPADRSAFPARGGILGGARLSRRVLAPRPAGHRRPLAAPVGHPGRPECGAHRVPGQRHRDAARVWAAAAAWCGAARRRGGPLLPRPVPPGNQPAAALHGAVLFLCAARHHRLARRRRGGRVQNRGRVCRRLRALCAAQRVPRRRRAGPQRAGARGAEEEERGERGRRRNRRGQGGRPGSRAGCPCVRRTGPGRKPGRRTPRGPCRPLALGVLSPPSHLDPPRAAPHPRRPPPDALAHPRPRNRSPSGAQAPASQSSAPGLARSVGRRGMGADPAWWDRRERRDGQRGDYVHAGGAQRARVLGGDVRARQDQDLPAPAHHLHPPNVARPLPLLPRPRHPVPGLAVVLPDGPHVRRHPVGRRRLARGRGHDAEHAGRRGGGAGVPVLRTEEGAREIPLRAPHRPRPLLSPLPLLPHSPRPPPLAPPRPLSRPRPAFGHRPHRHPGAVPPRPPGRHSRRAAVHRPRGRHGDQRRRAWARDAAAGAGAGFGSAGEGAGDGRDVARDRDSGAAAAGSGGGGCGGGRVRGVRGGGGAVDEGAGRGDGGAGRGRVRVARGRRTWHIEVQMTWSTRG